MGRPSKLSDRAILFYVVHVVVLHVCAPQACLEPTKVKRGYQSPGTGIVDSCELPCQYWESNPGPLQEQPVLLTGAKSLALW